MYYLILIKYLYNYDIYTVKQTYCTRPFGRSYF